MNICVTGASKGLGKALVETFLKDGHSVWGASRSKHEHASAHKDYRWTAVDLQKPEDVFAWKQEMDDAGFSPDIVICNASLLLDDMEQGLQMSFAEQVIDVNLLGTMRTVDAFLDTFLERGHGKFVLISSTSALRPSARSASYAASKAGASMAFRSLGAKFAPRGVQFAVVTMGPIQTEMWEGKKSALVPAAENAARRIGKFALSSSTSLFYPWLSTTLLRLSLCLPDSVFAAISTRFLK